MDLLLSNLQAGSQSDQCQQTNQQTRGQERARVETAELSRTWMYFRGRLQICVE